MQRYSKLSDLLQNISYIIYMQSQYLPKSCIIVGGRMGHGKSSFVKMIAHPQQISKIRVGAGTKSVTTQCTLYKIKDNLFEGGNHYIIDTPGIDSKLNYLNTLKSLDKIIVKQRCNIVGIIYLLDLEQGKEIKRDNITYVEQFLSLLKIDQQHKMGLTVLLFTKWDRNYKYKGKMKQLEDNLRRNLSERGWQKIMQRSMYWASEPEKDKKKYQKYLLSSQSLSGSQQAVLRSHLLKASNFEYAYEFYQTQLRIFENEVTNILLDYTKKKLQQNGQNKPCIRNNLILPGMIEQQKTQMKFIYNFIEKEPQTFIEKITRWIFNIKIWKKSLWWEKNLEAEPELQEYLEYQMKHIALQIISGSVIRVSDLTVVIIKNQNIFDLSVQTNQKVRKVEFGQQIKATEKHPQIKIFLSVYLPSIQKIMQLLEMLIKQYYNNKPIS